MERDTFVFIAVGVGISLGVGCFSFIVGCCLAELVDYIQRRRG